MIPDLESFSGLRRSEICQMLEDQGYQRLHGGNLCSVYHLPDSDVVLRISMTPAVSELACRYFMKNKGNRYLPFVYAHDCISDDVHICIMEKLVSVSELYNNGKGDYRGPTRAIASFPFGDTMHRGTHEMQAQDPVFMQAVRILVTCATESLDQLSENDGCLFLDRNVDGIMYRPENNTSYQPVLVDMLNYTTSSAELAMQLNTINSRLRALEFADCAHRTNRLKKTTPSPTPVI